MAIRHFKEIAWVSRLKTELWTNAWNAFVKAQGPSRKNWIKSTDIDLIVGEYVWSYKDEASYEDLYDTPRPTKDAKEDALEVVTELLKKY